ncbi:4Fe-4S binding protein [Berryella wangjianweii]|uniref:4Fe-4S binding protein n=1 Tax=Berryella wangjianweii TaxID=2734634 RepID=A0A6M8J8B9_9ACTN|nr:4Fe-4S binding protein [Berryella wangjianweii]QKF07639.1 4Fe-4S binding protein [Berryella wangjianweii]
MPSIDDIVSVAEAMESSPILVDRDRCVAVRNRNASCRRCVESCPCEAVAVGNNEVKVDPRACSACGACATVCPTNALVPLRPADEALLAASRQAMEANEGRVVIACARISSRHEADPERYAELPCLARVDESVLMKLAAAGAQAVTLVDGTCSTCRYRDTDAGINVTCGAFMQLTQAMGASVPIQRASAFPDDLRIDQAEGRFGTSRRDFFAETARSAKRLVSTAAKATVEKELGLAKAEELIGKRLRVGDSGALPQFQIERHADVINAMDALGQPTLPEVTARVFGRVRIDVDTCNGCGMCAVFCPTGALKRDERRKPYTNPEYLQFWASECVACGLCADVCWKKCLTVEAVIPTDELFSFDPVTFRLSAAAQQPQAFGKLNL